MHSTGFLHKANFIQAFAVMQVGAARNQQPYFLWSKMGLFFVFCSGMYEFVVVCLVVMELEFGLFSRCGFSVPTQHLLSFVPLQVCVDVCRIHGLALSS